jgi:hypothetical protein
MIVLKVVPAQIPIEALPVAPIGTLEQIVSDHWFFP